jgi:hypothetical protein
MFSQPKCKARRLFKRGFLALCFLELGKDAGRVLFTILTFTTDFQTDAAHFLSSLLAASSPSFLYNGIDTSNFSFEKAIHMC